MLIRRSQKNATPNQRKNKTIVASSLIRWSIQEVRRIAIRLARKRIQPAHIIAWSLWRRAHQAIAQRAHQSKTTTVMLARGQFSGVLIQSRETNLKAGAHAASTEGRSATILANVGDLVTARPISGAAPASRPP